MSSLVQKIKTWAHAMQVDDALLFACLVELTGAQPHDIAARVLTDDPDVDLTAVGMLAEGPVLGAAVYR